jgi:hypothetical protein
MPAHDLAAMKRVAIEGVIAETRHSETRRLGRGISENGIDYILKQFDIVEEYPDAFPFPALLLIGTWESNTWHIVAGFDLSNNVVHIVTVYRPDKERFEPDWRTRRIN